ncbi:MAG TPA: putative sulfate exporter family transporter [Candidatus Kapabacteria bacterium]|nr:putative sulfate exporter family transporter [Candidatus Kapabacteria bacterium]
MLLSRPVLVTLFVLLAIFALTPWCTPPLALLLGLVFALSIGNPYPKESKTWSKYIMQAAIVGLGFGLDFSAVVKAGSEGFVFTVCSILGTLGLGYLIRRWLELPRRTSILISVGTAICGASAIAAVGPVIDAEQDEMSVAFGCVFLLNVVALFVFPPMGHLLDLSQAAFGLWAGIAIHDTSSVVGAAQAFGQESLEIGTVVKLSRALWIVPLVLIYMAIEHRRRTALNEPTPKIPIPWFIGFFILASILRTVLGIPDDVTKPIVAVAKSLFSLTLFLIGAGLTLASLKAVGPKSLTLGVILWLFVSSATLLVVLMK